MYRWPVVGYHRKSLPFHQVQWMSLQNIDQYIAPKFLPLVRSIVNLCWQKFHAFVRILICRFLPTIVDLMMGRGRIFSCKYSNRTNLLILTISSNTGIHHISSQICRMGWQWWKKLRWDSGRNSHSEGRPATFSSEHDHPQRSNIGHVRSWRSYGWLYLYWWCWWQWWLWWLY